MNFAQHLIALAEIWSRSSGRTLAALASMVANDGKFFVRLQNGAKPRIGTFENFLSFFRDGRNWPDGRIPQEAVTLLDNFANIAIAEAA